MDQSPRHTPKPLEAGGTPVGPPRPGRRDARGETAFFDKKVPAAWRPLLEGLTELEALLDRPAADPIVQRDRAQEIARGLLQKVADLPAAGEARPEGSQAQHQLWFCEAILLWPHFAEAGGRIWVDSHGSRTLPRFEPDLRAGPAERAALATALQRTFGGSEADLTRIENTLRTRIARLPLRRAITAALKRDLGGAVGTPELAGEILHLFQGLYGPLPFRAGDVDLTLSGTTLVFGLPFDKVVFLRPDFGQRPAEERSAITFFLERMEKQRRVLGSPRFPGFGLPEGSEVEPRLLDEVTRAVRQVPGLEATGPDEVARTLGTMVTLVPSQRAELYLVHQIWGHGWHGCPGEIDWSYAALGELEEPIHPASGPRFGGAGTPVLREAFVVQDGAVQVDRDRLSQVVKADLRGRIRLALGLVVAEALADLVGHKYVRRRGPESPRLPTRSLFPEAPLKIDLSLRDTQSLLRAATRSYRRLLDEPAEARRLARELAASGLPGNGLGEAIAVALEAIAVEFHPVLETRMTQPLPGTAATLPVNLAQRVVLGLLALQAAVSRFLAEAEAACGAPATGARWLCPRCSIDLLVLLLGWFYQQDRELPVWDLPELLLHELLPTLVRFEHNLAAKTDP